MKIYSAGEWGIGDPYYLQGYGRLKGQTYCSCLRNCLRNIHAHRNGENRNGENFEALEDCPNCFGYGFAPISWSEVKK